MLYKDHAINPEYFMYTKKQLLQLWADIIRKPYADRYLLSESAKIEKGEAYGYITGVCYMSAFTDIIGLGNTCSHAIKADCFRHCLKSSGQLGGEVAQEAMKDRLDLLIKNPALFFEILRRENARLDRRAESIGFERAGRMNGTTDLDWTRITFGGLTIADHFSNVQWYDYTKNWNLARNYISKGIHVTLSWYKKLPTTRALESLDRGVNLAVVYRDKIPKTQIVGDRKIEVISGDNHDLRFLDPRGVIVGLKYKNQTMHEEARDRNADAHEAGYILLNGDAIV